MKWKFSSKKEGSGNSRKETLQNYEQKYLEKFDKVKSGIQKMKKKQKEIEAKELKAVSYTHLTLPTSDLV